MIDRLLGEVVARIAGGVLDGILKSLSARMSPARRTKEEGNAARRRPRPRPVTVSAEEMAARAREYEAWGRTRGLEPERDGHVDAHGAHLRGAWRGREVALTTGIVDDGPPRSPELLVWTDAIAVETALTLSPDDERPAEAGAASSSVRELLPVLETEGVRDIGVTSRFVRVRFEAFVRPKVLGAGWDALEVALAAIERAAKGEARRERPYR